MTEDTLELLKSEKNLSGPHLGVKYGYWSEHPRYPSSDWQEEVRTSSTRRSYWDWVAAQIEEELHFAADM